MKKPASLLTVLFTTILVAHSFCAGPRLVAQELHVKTTFKGGHDKLLGNCRFVAFSPDGKTLVSADDLGVINIWDIATQKKKQWVNNAIDERFESVREGALSPDGKILATTVDRGKVEDQGAILFDLTTGKRTGRLGVMGSAGNGWPTPISIAFSPDGKIAATGNKRGLLVLWDVGTEKEIRSFDGFHEQREVRAVALSADGKTLVAADEGSGDEDHPPQISVWDLSKLKNINGWGGHKGVISCVAFVKDGKTIATGSHDHTVKLWDVETGKEKVTLKPDGEVWSMAVSSDGKLLAAGTYGGTLALFDLGSGEKRSSIEAHSHCVSSIAFSQDGKLLATVSHDRTVKIWELAAAKNNEK